MELIKAIEFLKSCKEREEKLCDNLKNNISKSYFLAKHDFRVIENYEDAIETLSYVLEKLDDCQQRIIERNEINIKDLFK